MKIFVSIACFVDTDIIQTIKDCLDKARHPENIVFGVCLQLDETDNFFSDYDHHEQVRITRLDYRSARGPTHARVHCARLLDDEEFFLQIDSHTRFIAHWDSELIDIWTKCGDEKALITCFPLGLRKMDVYQTEPLNKSPTDFLLISRQNIRLGSVHCDERSITPTYNLSAAFLFGKSNCLRDVPLDPHMPFSFQKVEQQFYAVRLFTHGWNLYMPDRHIVFTNYDKAKHYVHGTQVWPPSNNARGDLSWQRALFYYGAVDRADLPDEVSVDLVKYGMGTCRTVGDFFALHGHGEAISNIKKKLVYKDNQWSPE
ncbi:UDP-N-acetylglucosamine-transferase [Luminiphilus sp.]|nr:UDP-N-acetylglucosamine-transferase [Luminiphilus sp.]